MKRTCNGCRAFDEGRHAACDLGYKIGDGKAYGGVVLSYKPLEECPKPKAYDEYFKLLRERKGYHA